MVAVKLVYQPHGYSVLLLLLVTHPLTKEGFVSSPTPSSPHPFTWPVKSKKRSIKTKSSKFEQNCKQNIPIVFGYIINKTIKNKSRHNFINNLSSLTCFDFVRHLQAAVYCIEQRPYTARRSVTSAHASTINTHHASYTEKFNVTYYNILCINNTPNSKH